MMVSKYSTRTLTCAADVLLALQGLVNAMARMHGNTYISGLWMEDLQIGLAWSVIKNPECVPPRNWAGNSLRESPEIPSWSWASRWGCWIWFERGGNNHVVNKWEGVGVDMDTMKSGKVKDKVLTVTGRLKPAEISPFQQKRNSKYRHMWSGAVYDPDSREKIGRIAYDADPYIAEYKLITCLLCTLRWKDSWQLICLALVPTNEAPDEFRRIGLIFLRDQKWFGHFKSVHMPYTNSHTQVKSIKRSLQVYKGSEDSLILYCDGLRTRRKTWYLSARAHMLLNQRPVLTTYTVIGGRRIFSGSISSSAICILLACITKALVGR